MSPGAHDAKDLEELERLARRMLELCARVRGERVDAATELELVQSAQPTAEDYAAVEKRLAKRRRR